MITLHYYGEVAEKTGCSQEGFPLENKNLASVLDRFREKYNIDMDAIQVAVNQELVTSASSKTISENDEVVLLSAFAGG